MGGLMIIFAGLASRRAFALVHPLACIQKNIAHPFSSPGFNVVIFDCFKQYFEAVKPVPALKKGQRERLLRFAQMICLCLCR